MEFDPSEQHYKLDQNRSELLQAEQEITKAKADAAVVAAQDKVALLKARFDVRRAELDVQKNELVSTIDARKNDLALEQAQASAGRTGAGRQVAQRIESGHHLAGRGKTEQGKAGDGPGAGQHQQDARDSLPWTAWSRWKRTRERRADFSSAACLCPNIAKAIRSSPAERVGQVIDPKEMEMIAKVGELERNNIKEGQSVDIQLDALPGSTFHGTVKTVGGNNTRRFWEDDTSSKFEVTITLASTDPRMRPGLTAQVFINGDPRKECALRASPGAVPERQQAHCLRAQRQQLRAARSEDSGREREPRRHRRH